MLLQPELVSSEDSHEKEGTGYDYPCITSQALTLHGKWFFNFLSLNPLFIKKVDLWEMNSGHEWGYQHRSNASCLHTNNTDNHYVSSKPFGYLWVHYVLMHLWSHRLWSRGTRNEMSNFISKFWMQCLISLIVFVTLDWLFNCCFSLGIFRIPL